MDCEQQGNISPHPHSAINQEINKILHVSSLDVLAQLVAHPFPMQLHQGAIVTRSGRMAKTIEPKLCNFKIIKDFECPRAVTRYIASVTTKGLSDL